MDANANAGARDATEDAVARLQGARPSVPAAQCESALARLRSALFGATPEYPTLKRYRIERRIGEGSGGVVHLAHDTELDRPVAIKFIGAGAVERDGSSSSRERLLREAESLARAPHPNVLTIYDVGSAIDRDGDDAIFLVLEYVEGADLRVWLEQGQSWSRVLEVFVAAGHGLAAAHAVGVTHRDFKPANAIIGTDDRVRVLDFGLARAATSDAPRMVTLESGEVDVQLTDVGSVVGTPAYMSPEQHAGKVATPLSDQYSFCAALWEGLFGARPFPGRGLEEIAAMKRRGAPRPPKDHAVPPAIVRALRRGLDPTPAQRFASMHALLAALTHRPALRGRLAGAVLGACVITGAAAWWIAADKAPRCADSDAGVDVARRHAIDRAFAASDVPFAADTLARLTTRIDRFDATWHTGYRALCEVGPEQLGDEAFDLRMACLHRQQDDADALLGVLGDADAGVVARALEVANTLPDPDACSDAARVATAATDPIEPRIAPRVAELRAELARVHALDSAGKVGDALLSARGVVREAADLGYAPLLAEAQFHLGNVEEANGDYALAAMTLESAQTTAVACNHELIAARAAQSLVFVVGERLGRLDDALVWAQRASVEFDRVGGSDDPSLLISAIATAYHSAGRYREAKDKAYEALAAHEALGVEDDARRGTLHNNLGDMLRTLGELDAAREQLQKAEAMWERAYGPDHPKLAMALNNLSAVDLSRGDGAAAIPRLRRVVSIRERAFGPDHVTVATSLANLGIAFRLNEDYDDARAAIVRAQAIMRARGPGEHARLGALLIGLGLVDAAQGNHRAALTTLDEAISLMESSLPPTHPDLARALDNRAITFVHLGDLERGLADFDRGMQIAMVVYGSGHAKLAKLRFDFARVLLDRGEPARALAFAHQGRVALADAEDPIARELDAWIAARAEATP